MFRISSANTLKLQPFRYVGYFLNPRPNVTTPQNATSLVNDYRMESWVDNVHDQFPRYIPNDDFAFVQEANSNMLEANAKLQAAEAQMMVKVKKLYENTMVFMKLLTTKDFFSIPQCLSEAARLLDKGVIFDEDSRKKIIMHALKFNNAGILKLITDYQLKTNDSFNPFDYWTEKNPKVILSIFENGHGLNVLQFFINHGYNVNVPCYNTLLWTPLLELGNHITHEGHLVLLDFLLRTGVEVNAIDSDFQYSALTRVIHFCYYRNPKIAFEAVKLLLQYGADPNLSDAWHHAVFQGYHELTHYLLTADYPKKADLNLKNENGCNAAHIVLRKKNKSHHDLQMMQLLIKMGIDTSAKDNDGLSVTDYLSREMLTKTMQFGPRSLQEDQIMAELALMATIPEAKKAVAGNEVGSSAGNNIKFTFFKSEDAQENDNSGAVKEEDKPVNARTEPFIPSIMTVEEREELIRKIENNSIPTIEAFEDKRRESEEYNQAWRGYSSSC